MADPTPGAARPYRGKRALDLSVLVVLAVPAAIVGAVAALAVRCSSRGPILFRQERVGRDARPFEILKLRTMVDRPATSAMPDPERITHVGRVLRRLSLDELPQLINVARGEMSIVGPRPTLAYQVDRYTPAQRGRLAVRPGLTGLAQLAGRNALDWAARIELDLEYVQRQSVGTDLSIIVRTVPAMLSGRGTDGHPDDDPIARD
jgi:lipopolysaccharide/colanic/teichoic acid biosynthesis glycosyltransferase